MERSGAGTWSVKPCSVLRKNMIQCHVDSAMHKEAVEHEATRLSVERHSGIQQAFQRQISLQRKSLIGTLKIVYCLSKEEIPLTKYKAIIDLASSLGYDCLKELEVGANTRYRSHAIIGEFLKVQATVVKEEELPCVTKSKLYSLLRDESTDTAEKSSLS